MFFVVVVVVVVVFKLFHAQIVPSLLYATEIWSDRENKQTELVHLYVCKVFITIPTVTPDDIISAELGRYPLYIEAAAKMYIILVSCAQARYSKMTFQSSLTLRVNGHENWLTQVLFTVEV